MEFILNRVVWKNVKRKTFNVQRLSNIKSIVFQIRLLAFRTLTAFLLKIRTQLLNFDFDFK